jgi:hypothetical protein
MFFKKKIRNRVYSLYLNGVDICSISIHMGLRENDVNEIIDFMNDICLNYSVEWEKKN